jgi:hypothetical protein
MAYIEFKKSRGTRTTGNQYKHRYVDTHCSECGNDHAYIDRWNTLLKFTCMRRECRHTWYIKRWEEQADGRRRDTYVDYVGEEGVAIEDEFKERQNRHKQTEA